MSFCYYEQGLHGPQHRASAQTTLNLMFKTLSMVGCHPTVLQVSVMGRQSSVKIWDEKMGDTLIMV